MESASNILIALDAGHGGSDNGASAGSRREKDDNLRLALETIPQLKVQGFQVICTRTNDAFVPLADRAKLANEKDADLFISLHRAYFPTSSDEAYGVAGFIHATASLESSGKAAHLILSALEDAGVQRITGISRGNHAVLRRAEMPAFLLELGFLSNETDNRLFDENLTAYARAIAKGASSFFELSFNEHARPQSASSSFEENEISDMQQLLEARYGFGLPPSGRFDRPTKKAAVIALQIELNGACDAQIPVNGVIGPETLNAFRAIRPGDKGGLAALLQVLLILNGYDPGDVDGYFGPRTGTALRFFQRDHYLAPDGKAGIQTFMKLLQ